MDIRDALAALAPDTGRPPPDVVAADLERGRHAVVRRRRRLQVTGATLGVAAVLGLTATVQAVSAPDGPGALTATAAPIAFASPRPTSTSSPAARTVITPLNPAAQRAPCIVSPRLVVILFRVQATRHDGGGT